MIRDQLCGGPAIEHAKADFGNVLNKFRDDNQTGNHRSEPQKR